MELFVLRFVLGLIPNLGGLVVDVFRLLLAPVWLPFQMLRLMLARPPACLPEGTYAVDYVCDGDTINVLTEGKSYRIRLAGIDAPEKDQPMGEEISYVVKKMLPKGTPVRVQCIDYDRKWKRHVAWIWDDEGQLINAMLVAMGLAYWYRDFAPDDRYLAELEALARQDRVGVWSRDDLVRPWDHRQAVS